MTRVTTPAEGFSGVVAGVTFTDGVGETDNANALNYFRRHGYGIGSKPAVVPVPGDARTGVEQLQGDDTAKSEADKPAPAAKKAPAKKAAPKKPAKKAATPASSK